MGSVSTDRRNGLNSSAAIKVPCRAASTGALVLSALQTVDNVVLAAGDRVLVKDQVDQTTNGIYVADTGNWARDLDFDGAYDALTGTIMMVLEGTQNANTYWRCTSANPVRFGSSTITFAHAMGSDSALQSFIQAGAGAVATDLQTRGRHIIDAADFGFLTTATAAANMAALGNIATRLNALGGGVLLIAPGAYNVLIGVGNTAMALANLNGFTVIAPGATINDTTVYAGADTAILFSLTTCINTKIACRVVSQAAVTTLATNVRGLVGVQLLHGCLGVDIDLDQTGGIYAVQANKAFNDATSFKSRQIRARIRATGTYYGYLAQFSGDDAQVDLDADTCGRNFFCYGVRNVRLNVRSKNQQVTSLISAYQGYGCEDIKVDYYDHESTSCQPAAPIIGINFQDGAVAPSTMRNIHLHMDTKNPVAAPWSHGIVFNKYTDGAATADAAGRGHVLDGFKLTGVMDNNGLAGINHLQMTNGAFAAPDVQRNVDVHDLTLIGASGFQMPLQALVGFAHFRNIKSDHYVVGINAAAGRVLYQGVWAAEFENATGDTDTHTYLHSECTTGGNQGTVNKTFIDTDVGGRTYSDVPRTGHGVLFASKQLAGDLTPANQVFLVRVPAGIGARFLLHYALVADQTDNNPASRSETYGIKSFSATLSGAGVWTGQTANANAIAERTQNTASVVTPSLVDGTAAGAYIAVACTNYNGANARGSFFLEMMPMANGDFLTSFAIPT